MHFAFHGSLSVSPQDALSTPVLSIIQTFSMMLGDINYRDAFLEPFLRNELAYPLLSFIQLISFTMFVPIVLMNLLVSNVSLNFLFFDHLRHFAVIVRILLHLPPRRENGTLVKSILSLRPVCAGHNMGPKGCKMHSLGKCLSRIS